jgi:hypothetical protein
MLVSNGPVSRTAQVSPRDAAYCMHACADCSLLLEERVVGRFGGSGRSDVGLVGRRITCPCLPISGNLLLRIPVHWW